MRRFALIALAAAGLSVAPGQVAFAADMPARAPAYQVMPIVSGYNWSGFYVGVHAGYGWGNLGRVDVNSVTGATVASSTFKDNGILGGGQIGYNWMASSNFLLGLEVDLSAANITGSDTVVVAAPASRRKYDEKLDWFGTARGRLGYTVNNWLLFGTGGFAWGNDKLTRTQVAGVTGGAIAGRVETASKMKTGWTVGGGLEYGLTPNWSVKAEYLYVSLGQDGYLFPIATRRNDENLKLHTVQLGVNYRF